MNNTKRKLVNTVKYVMPLISTQYIDIETFDLNMAPDILKAALNFAVARLNTFTI